MPAVIKKNSVREAGKLSLDQSSSVSQSEKVPCPKCHKSFTSKTINKYGGLCGTCHNEPLKVSCTQCRRKMFPSFFHNGLCHFCENGAPCKICSNIKILNRKGICSVCSVNYSSMRTIPSCQLCAKMVVLNSEGFCEDCCNSQHSILQQIRSGERDPTTTSPSQAPKTQPPQTPTKMTTIKFERMTNNKCSICLGVFENDDDIFVVPQCFHYFHEKCSGEWIKQHNSCPLCRKRID